MAERSLQARPPLHHLGYGMAAIAALALPLLVACAGLGGGSTGSIHARLGYAEESGLRVVDVPAGGAADRAGLRVDDRILYIDGEPVSTMQMREIVERLRGPIGSAVELTVVREGTTRTLSVEREAFASNSR